MLFLSLLSLAGTTIAAVSTTTFCSTIDASAPTSRVRTYIQADVETSVNTATVTKTSTPTSTFTPASRTVTKNIDVTHTATEDAQQQTDTFYSTTTTTQTITSVNTANFTVTTTSTTTFNAGGGTTTMSVGSLYTPLASQLAAQGLTVGYSGNPGQVPNKRANRVRDQGIEAPAEQFDRRQVDTSPTSTYPAYVLCNKYIQKTSTTTATATATVSKTVTAARGTITRTYTSDLTITTTLTPSDASTTVDGGTVTTSSTFYTTVSTTSTSTIWTTSTVFQGAQATYWPQCQPSNFVDTVNSLGAYHYGYYARPTTIATGVGSATDCCNKAMSGGYAGAFWDHSYCYGMISSTCNGAQPNMWFNSSSTYTYKPFVFFSTDCGTIKYRGRCDGCPNYE